jgi:GT2 family glycosyltransferase
MNSPTVAIIVVNWNQYQLTIECLASLKNVTYSNFQIILVDNGSKDGSPQKLRDAFPEVFLLENPENTGYVGGNNLGLEYALQHGFEYCLLLNNDTEVSPDFLSLMLEGIRADDKIGIAGPAIYYHSLPDTLWSAGGAIDWEHGSTRMLGIGERVRDPSRTLPQPVDFVTGCALLIRSDVIKKIGLLDERFFAYYEETEWCVRVKKAGFKIVFIPQACIWHKISPQAREASPLVHYYMTRNRLLFLKLTGATWRAWYNTLFLEDLRTILSWSLRPRWKEKRAQRNVAIMAIRDYFLGRFGKRFI